MHSFISSIGFRNCKTLKEMNEIVKYALDNSDTKKIIEDEEAVFILVEKQFGENFGLHIFGQCNEKDEIEVLYHYPYFQGYEITTPEVPIIDKLSYNEAYTGVCDEFKIGVSLIFYLQNIVDYKRQKDLTPLTGRKPIDGVIITGLSSSGKILLPISRNEQQKKTSQESTINRMNLIAAARDGDKEAMESLTLDDMDTYSMVSRRVLTEDVLSIVESYFMPFGIECDQYSVLGDIIDYHVAVNHYTKEEVYIMNLICNDLNFDICINKNDLVGEPAVGRRFMGNVWLQGNIVYAED